MAMKNSFLTIKQVDSNELVIKKSKFIAHVDRVTTEAEAQQFITKIKDQNKKATHNCFAYVVGATDSIQRESDNGEPSGTAGVPILDAIKNMNLHNTAVVVTRYFGGIKLGAGGLIRAYSNSASDVMEKSGISQMTLKTGITVSVSYKLNEQLQYFLKQNGLQVYKTNYGTDVQVETAVISDSVSKFENQITNLLAGDVQFKIGQESYFESPYHTKKKE
ncbi:YigZ family protein [Fructilactobacillus fructivorans]|uniref:YigZ family protein n=2 Tax=Fructilactobacillus fructivorans TaxID=1614 RepID=A0AAE6P2A1_9LACO|nr:YigZ family protein [Fructilactobacillus fructivorans]RDV65409.1 YigZ family protein [Fructilactobacillus fructivorans]